MKYIFVFLFTLIQAQALPSFIQAMAIDTPLSKIRAVSDIRRNYSSLQKLSVHIIRFDEGRYHWKMLLVTNPKKPKGPFEFLPHDNEDAAFDTAVYASLKYGGGFLAVMSNNKRYFMGQDPNRNFGDSKQTAKTCKKQHYPAPKYSKIVFKIIDYYRASGMPYLALHINKNGYYGNGGSGGVSILKSSKIVKSYPAHKNITKKNHGLSDEDSLVYTAGKSSKPDRRKLSKLLRSGLNTKYEIVSSRTNDCSMSNFVILNKHTTKYYNIETQHGNKKTQKKMFDLLMHIK